MPANMAIAPPISGVAITKATSGGRLMRPTNPLHLSKVCKAGHPVGKERYSHHYPEWERPKLHQPQRIHSKRSRSLAIV